MPHLCRAARRAGWRVAVAVGFAVLHHHGATIGAGSTISKDAPEGQLTLSRARQATVHGWKRPRKKPSDGQGD